MNNFKKLLASAMALSMVTSVMPVSASVTTPDNPTYCSNDGLNFVASIYERFGDLTEVNSETMYETNKTLFSVVKGNKNRFGAVMGCYTADSTYRNYAKSLMKMVNGYEILFETGQWSDIDDSLLLAANPATLNQLESDLTSATWAKDYTKYALAYQKFLNEYEFYENLTSEDKDTFDSVKTELDYQLAELGHSEADTLDEWINDLETDLKLFLAGKTSSDKEASVNDTTASKNAVEARIKSIKANYKYKLFADNEAIESIIAQYEDILDEIANVKEATNSKKNESYLAFIKKSNGSSVATRLKGYLDTTTADTLAKKLAVVEENLSFADYNVLKDFMEEVVGSVWEFDTKQYGDYHVDKSGASIYATTSTVKTVLDLVGGEKGAIIYNFDREEGTFGWDELVAYMEEAIASYEALTDGLKGLDSINLTVADKDAIIAADEALYFFEKNTGNLTKAQARDVKNAERKVNELMDTYRTKFGSLTVTTGWVDMGNGNWKFYEADGTAPTRWVCTAKDTWYYVSNGVMLRNAWVWRDANSAYYVGNDGVMVYGPTTVDGGYALDANGLWHK